jgi:hypothetical protein
MEEIPGSDIKQSRSSEATVTCYHSTLYLQPVQHWGHQNIVIHVPSFSKCLALSSNVWAAPRRDLLNHFPKLENPIPNALCTADDGRCLGEETERWTFILA